MSFSKVAGACILLFWLGGCVQTKTTPGYARAGDHVTIGLGGIVRNAGGDATLKPSDLTLTLTDALGTQFNLQPRFVFKTFGDYSAQMNIFSFNGVNASVGLVGMVPYDGGWMVVVPLTPPADYDNPLPLAVGPATISVTSPKLINTKSAIEGDLSAVPIEIIAGTSPEDIDFVRQFGSYLTTQESFVVSPDDLTGIDDVGGAFFTINYNDDTFFQAGLEPVVVPSNHNPYVQVNYNVLSNGDGTGKILVTLLNPAGFKTVATAGPNSSYLSDLTLRLNYFGVVADTNRAIAKANFSLDTFNSYYIGTDGSVLPGVTPVLTHSIDL
ncbi:MAG: hypothetical protein KDI33_13785 [Halioglobus sp.]|nr:hypothetical protein [Halioglobus sp.]